MTIEEDCLKIVFSTLQKGSRKYNRKERATLFRFSEVAIDPYIHCRCYLDRVKNLRATDCTRMFVTTCHTFRNASGRTIGCWIKDFIQKATCAITSNAPTVRAVAASTAFSANVPISVILEAAKWSQESTFRQHYLIPANHEQTFQNAVFLSDCASPEL